MTQTFTQEHKAKLEQYLATHTLPSGLGSKESACSIAAINLAVSGELTDEIPDCMSGVLGTAAVVLQDAMPSEMRNSLRYKTLLPDMAGTGREHEQERLAITRLTGCGLLFCLSYNLLPISMGSAVSGRPCAI
jgi:hypothetical protein